MRIASAALAVLAVCGAVVPLACSNGDSRAGAPTTGGSMGSESGRGDVDVPSDDAIPYGRCNDACYDDPGFGCAECSGPAGCADPVIEGDFKVCSPLCETVADCPPPPPPNDVRCEYGGCYLGCEAGPCPQDQTCVVFFDTADAPVCMYGV